MPLASDAEQQTNFPITVRNEMRPSLTKSANLACGMPLPRASGKYRHNRYPVAQGAKRGYQNAMPARSARGIHAGRQATGKQNERDDHQTD